MLSFDFAEQLPSNFSQALHTEEVKQRPKFDASHHEPPQQPDPGTSGCSLIATEQAMKLQV